MGMKVYLITNTINGKGYVGIDSNDNDSRWKAHIRNSKSQVPVQLIDKKIKQYGKENFDYSILETCDDIKILKEKEREYIQKLNTFVENGKGYNLTLGGDGCEGFKMPIDKIHSGEKHYMFGKHLSKEEREKRSLGMMGKNTGDSNGSKKLEVRSLLSKQAKGRTGSLNPNFRHGRRINGKHDPIYISTYYRSHQEQIRLNASMRYYENHEVELERARQYRLTHKKVKGRWVTR